MPVAAGWTAARPAACSFAKRFMDDQAAGAPEFKKLRAQGEAHPIETTGRQVRSMFAWRADVDKDYTEGSVAR